MEAAPEVRFARTDDGVTIAYQVVGQGPPLVWMPSLSNIVAQWRVPVLRRAYQELTNHVTLVLYDGRGTGASDRRIDTADLGVDAHVRDLTAVLGSAGIRTTSLLGYYHSVSTAIAFAAAQPERVQRMVLFGGAARLREAISPQQTQALLSLVEQDWGLFANAAAAAWLGWDDPESGRGVAEAFRTATTATIAQAWFAAAQQIDVTPMLGDVRAPTLVLHRQAEEQIPAEVARRLATGLPNAQLLELPGTTPTLFIEDAESDLRLVSDFVTTGKAQRTSNRTILTPRERDVLKLLAAGESNGEIAKRLGITVHTVERHSANLYRKIGARGRTDAAAYALRHGLA
ncbi:alpha/beta fold hydrolase [Cryptosporangium sp. NPDC048952]|uniref:alpha/beta fold hydrolase n=1 Tax=Cryptosporangium sp. NPDC048952 TaxID=3363961 RepID=UPI0037150193